MRKLPYFNDMSSLPNNSRINVSTSECIRQAVAIFGPDDQAEDDPEDPARLRWIGGDAWFGGVMACVELAKHAACHSTFIVKNNTALFPKTELLSVLKARYPRNPVGQWVCMTSTIADVDILCIAYSWSKRGVSYFITTCGDSNCGTATYRTAFENEYGEAVLKDIQRPDIASFLYKYLPLVDEHNRQRQGILAIESCWPTRHCWFRLGTTLLGMCVVDFHRLAKSQHPSKYGDTTIKQFADYLTRSLCKKRTEKNPMVCDGKTLTPFGTRKNHDPNSTRATLHGATMGKFKTRCCFICRKYYGKNYRHTRMQCPDCLTPICAFDRTTLDPYRTSTCFEEHLKSTNPLIKCNGQKQDRFPQKFILIHHPGPTEK